MELIPYLLKAKGVENIYCIDLSDSLQDDEDKFQSDAVEYCTAESAVKRGLQADMLLFDRNCRETALAMKHAALHYLSGRLASEEEYFDLWEQFRQSVSHIYIEREKLISPEENISDADQCEVLDWERNQTDIELSVILPVYNVAEYLPQCIEALSCWKAPYVEYLFVNDGSTDDSEDIIKRYRNTDHRIRLINKENGGCASARNRGIEEAKGRYLGFVDSDDYIDESMFCKLLRRVLLGNFELAYCGYKEFYEETGRSENVLNDCLKEPYLSGTYRQDKVQNLAVNTRVAVWRCIYKKDVLCNNKIRFHEDLRRFDDLPFRVEYLFAAKSAVCVPEYLYYYRLGRKGQDVVCPDEGFWVHFDIFRHLDRYVDQFKDKRLADLLQVVKLQTHGFAISKINDRKLKQEYLRQAKKQMDRNMGYIRTVCLMLMYTGKGNLGWYTRMKLKKW